MKIVTAGIIIQGDKLLIVRRALMEKLAGFWEFAGGKLEENETLQECIERELREELSIETVAGNELYRSSYIYEHGSFEIVAIEVTIKSGYPILTVHDELAWIKIEELINYKLLPADVSIAKFLLDRKHRSLLATP